MDAESAALAGRQLAGESRRCGRTGGADGHRPGEVDAAVGHAERHAALDVRSDQQREASRVLQIVQEQRDRVARGAEQDHAAHLELSHLSQQVAVRLGARIHHPGLGADEDHLRGFLLDGEGAQRGLDPSVAG